MSKSLSLLSALLCTFIWGTTFIAQDTGMDDIGPFTFNAVRFFVGFLAIIPLFFLFELKKFKSELKLDFKNFFILSFLNDGYSSFSVMIHGIFDCKNLILSNKKNFISTINIMIYDMISTS